MGDLKRTEKIGIFEFIWTRTEKEHEMAHSCITAVRTGSYVAL